jgi:hypothetical protein
VRITGEQQARQLGEPWLDTRADEKCPEEKCEARQTGQMFEKDERFVVHRVALRARREAAAMPLVVVMSHADVMIYGDCRIVNQVPPRAPVGRQAASSQNI